MRCVVIALVHAAEDMRRVSIGVALMQRPGALIVDSPTGGLSHSAGNRIMHTLKVQLQGRQPLECLLFVCAKCQPVIAVTVLGWYDCDEGDVPTCSASAAFSADLLLCSAGCGQERHDGGGGSGRA